MNGQDTSMPGGVPEARAELRERCLALVRRWQPLAQGAWQQGPARALGEEIDQIAETSERLGLQDVNGSALELAAYLCSFVDDRLTPSPRDLERLAQMVNRMGAVLSDLSDSTPAPVHPLPSARGMPAAENVPATSDERAAPISAVAGLTKESLTVDAAHAASTQPAADDAAASNADPAPVETAPRLTQLPRTVCLFGLGGDAVPGMSAGLRERGYEVREFADAEALLGFLAHAVPGALLVDARKLRVIARVSVQYASMRLSAGRMPTVIAISPDGDLGHRLLAMRAGAAALFTAPVDSLRVIGKLDELLRADTLAQWRVLLVEADRTHAADAARALAERGMTARLAANGQSALSALGEFRPDVIVIDCDLPDVSGVELTQLIRQQNEFAAVPIVLAVDSGAAAQRFDAIAAGGDEVLLKPVKARHLIAAVQARVQRAHWLREAIGTPGGRDLRTGLYSRTTLVEKVEAALGDRSAALLCIALDRAPLLREQIGLAGLAALDAHVGNLLRGQLDEADVAAQFQDFNYFVLLNRRSRSDLTAVAESLREVLGAQPWQYNERSHALTASMGLALLAGEHASIDGVVNNAQAAQLAAAHLGGNRVLWFEPKEAALLPIDPLLAVRAVLSRPLVAEQTQFECQPVAPLAGKLQGQFELGFSVRSVQHPGTSVSYAELAPVAIECRRIGGLDRMLLEHALQVREEQLRRGRQLRLFVPQAVSSALESEFSWWLERELKSRHLSGTGLTIALPCSALIDAGARAREQIRALHPHGVRFCLVDYGRDWAAVHALKNLEVDFVRLAPQMVAELGTTPAVADTLLALVRKAHACGAAAIAPDVDSLQRAHLLLRLGVDYGVGPAFSRAQAQPDFDFNRPLW